MNPFGSTETIVVDGMSIRLPNLLGNPNDLSPTSIFEKPSWMPDSEAVLCLGCGSKFTQLRRKHHCRNCGKIFCSKCCVEKIPLPHFGTEEPDKVCNNCKLIVELMIKAKSQDPLLKYEAVLGFASLLTNVAGMSKVIECGGIHIMLSVAMNGDAKLKSAVASALHSVIQSMTLNHFLVEAGCLKVLKHFLSTSESNELLSDSLSSLNLLCMDAAIRIQVLKEGLVDSLLTTIRSASGITSVFASRILQLLVCNFEHHEFILQNHRRVIPGLFEALQTEDYQMQGCVSKMLMYFSANSSTFREMIIYEDMDRDYPLLFLLKGTCQSVLVNVTCIVANLSLSIEEAYTSHYISGLCELLTFVNKENSELLTQLGRGLANFAENASNTLHMIHHLPNIVSNLLKSCFEAPRVHACRLLVSLFSSELPTALDVLSQSGLDEFIETIFDLPGITDVLNNALLRKVSRLSVCKQQV
ncbi:hypothetical protein JTE90_006059 [Oedothorax gibbosus]|uniref:FYVE-type domain-containing protein n=1 Tax=Oedothorax gibbosus TaxID=931172 RepID=A0AAV6V3G3_9ARAC|nr:hypothetical protein JTE90_006059 [Oedothorax gibbosus]